MELTYQKATLADLPRIVPFVKAAIAQMQQANILQWDDIYPTQEDFAQDIADDTLYFGAIGGVPAVAFVLNHKYDVEYQDGAWQYPQRPYHVLHRLCVNPAYQNKGVARQTLVFIEQEVARLGSQAIRLDAFTQNPYALQLYRGFGYAQVGFADWRMGRFYLMEKYLA